MASNAVRTHQELLSAIDSLEVMSHRASFKHSVIKDRNSPPSFLSIASSESSNEAEVTVEWESTRIPPYMKVPPYRCQKFKKMTEEEWMQLQTIEKLRKLSQESKDSTRRSSIKFEDIEQRGSFRTQRSSTRSSILKRPSMQVEGTTMANDALQPIRKKCLEAVDKLKVESVLRILCEQNENP